jgi:hypothetical protein
MTIDDILELVGTLDDGPGEGTGRERFRRYLGKSATDLGLVRDYVEFCLQTAGPQYNRALQDLVNHAARLMGFDVTFGRYAGVTNAVGFDGLWSHDSLHIVVEVKTTDAYTIKAATLVGYVDALISEKVIPDWDHALGLYVVGRTDAGLQQLENAIVAERRMQQLRVATVESVLSLAELVQAQLLTLDEVVSIIRPTGVLVDDTVKLLSRVAAKPADLEPLPSEAPAPAQLSPQVTLAVPARLGSPTYFLTPVSDDKEASAEQTIRSLLDQGWYVFGDTTPGRKLIKAGDRICFYRSAVGVVASATVMSAVEKKTIKFVRNPDAVPDCPGRCRTGGVPAQQHPRPARVPPQRGRRARRLRRPHGALLPLRPSAPAGRCIQAVHVCCRNTTP